MLPYSCNVCNTYYKTKKQCDEHTITCSIAHERLKLMSDVEYKDDIIPSQRLMYELLKIALNKCNTLEQEISKLKKLAYKERKQIDVIDYLHNHVKDVGEYHTFMDSMRGITKPHLDAVFNGNIVDGIVALLSDTNDAMPFVSFSHKPGQIYVYMESDDSPPQWMQMQDSFINQMFDIFANRFICAFTAWAITVPELNQDNEDSQNKKVVLKKKIWAMHLSEDFKHHKFKLWLYNHVKRDAKSIVEYEF